MPLIMFVSSSFNTYVNLPKKKENPKNDNVFKVNGHRLKVYFDNFSVENDSIELSDPVYKA